MTLEERAKEFATRAHKGQVRKYIGDPYILHPWMVAALVKTVPSHTEEMVAAAWLHDTVEDTTVTLDEIRKEFGPAVASLVSELTDVSRPEDGNRAARKAIDCLHLARASAEAKTIKLADLIHNTSDIVANNPNFAKTYMKEKLLLLEVLKEGDSFLYAQAKFQVDEYYKRNK